MKYFPPGFAYHKSPEEETTREEWELLQSFRKIKNDKVKKIAIKTIEDFAKLK